MDLLSDLSQHGVLAAMAVCIVALRSELLQVRICWEVSFIVCAHPFLLSLKLGDNHSKKFWQHNFISDFFSTPSLSFLLTSRPYRTVTLHRRQQSNNHNKKFRKGKKHHQLPSTTQEPGNNATMSSLDFWSSGVLNCWFASLILTV